VRLSQDGRAPVGAVNVSRGRVDRFGWGPLPDDPDGARLRQLLEERPGVVAQIRQHLAGRVLACSCPLEAPCHGDVLLRVANGMTVR
jgi:hypothetical protein